MIASRLIVDSDFAISDLDRRVFGSFVEHMGRCVYTGIYEPGVPAHDIALYFFTLIFKRKQRYEALESCLRYCSGADH